MTKNKAEKNTDTKNEAKNETAVNTDAVNPQNVSTLPVFPTKLSPKTEEFCNEFKTIPLLKQRKL